MLAKLAAGLVAAVVLTMPVAGQASQKDPRLGPLFERLKEANAQEARGIESQIWQIWSKADDSATESLMRLAMRAMQAGDVKGAFVLFDAITTQAPDFAEGWNQRATALFTLGALDESIAAINKTLELEPRHFGALSGLGMIRMRKNQDNEALKAFEDAAKVHPNLPGVKTNIENLRKKVSRGAI
mgnify:CR=1 FL=1